MNRALSFLGRRPTEIAFVGICVAFLGPRIHKLWSGEAIFDFDDGSFDRDMAIDAGSV